MSLRADGTLLMAECEAIAHPSGLRQVAEFRGATFEDSCVLFAEAGWRVLGFRKILPDVVLCPECVARAHQGAVTVNMT